MLLFIIINKNYYHAWAPMRVSSILGNSRHLFSHSVITMKVLAPTPPLPLHRSQGTLVKSQEVKSCLLFRSSSGFSAHSEGFHCFPWLEASSSRSVCCAHAPSVHSSFLRVGVTCAALWIVQKQLDLRVLAHSPSFTQEGFSHPVKVSTSCKPCPLHSLSLCLQTCCLTSYTVNNREGGPSSVRRLPYPQYLTLWGQAIIFVEWINKCSQR